MWNKLNPSSQPEELLVLVYIFENFLLLYKRFELEFRFLESHLEIFRIFWENKVYFTLVSEQKRISDNATPVLIQQTS